MNKQEKIIVAILLLALVGSFYYSNREAQKRVAYQRAVAAQEAAVREAAATEPAGVATTEPAGVVATEPAGAVIAAATPTAESSVVQETAVADGTQAVSALVPEVVSSEPERLYLLSNDVAVVTLTSKGGAIQSAQLLKYHKALDPNEGVVALDFSAAPSLSLENLPGLGVKSDYQIEVSEDGRTATLQAVASNGLTFQRTLALTDGYQLTVVDTLTNETATAQVVPAYAIRLGTMQRIGARGTDDDLAIDAKVQELGKEDIIEIKKTSKKVNLGSLFGASGGGCRSATISPVAPVTASVTRPGEIHWTGVRERFFLQILTPKVPAVGMTLEVARNPLAAGGALEISALSSSLQQPEVALEAGQALTREYTLFVGPRKLSELRKMGSDYVQVMRFGTWGFFCRLLLDLLNFLYGLIPNYGVAIILLTALMRLILYPVNKKNTESMRKMQEVQPLLKEVQQKFKDDPKKLQAETMRIYSENKVNPLSSCLPMLIQLPVFIALFTVLRSSVELRFADFLWVADLSEPENLWRDVFGFGVNLLPLAMAGTMALQSRLTPTAGDAAQQKMMMVMMPVMMLVMFYQFPAALGLYWTVSQLFAIVGLLRNRKKRQGVGGAGGMVVEAPRETRQMRRDRLRRGE